MSVTLSNPVYSPFCQVKDDVTTSHLVFEPGQIRRFDFQFAADAQDIGGELQITSVILQMGRELSACIRCEGSSSEEFVTSTTRSEFPARECRRAINDVVVHCPAEILPRTANVELVLLHEPPALRGECYPLYVKLINQEKVEISQVDLTVTCSKGRVHDQPKIDSLNCGSSIRLSSPTIAATEGHEWTLYVQMEQPGTHNITFQVLS